MVADTSTSSAVVSISVPISPGDAPFGGLNCTATGNLPDCRPTVACSPAPGTIPGVRPR